jgi:hypothetical protein
MTAVLTHLVEAGFFKCSNNLAWLDDRSLGIGMDFSPHLEREEFHNRLRRDKARVVLRRDRAQPGEVILQRGFQVEWSPPPIVHPWLPEWFPPETLHQIQAQEV